MKAYLKRTWYKLRYNHILRLFFDGLTWLGLEITPYYIVLEGLFGKTIPALEHPPEGYVPGFFGPGDMKAVAALPGRTLPEEKLHKRLEKGHLCYGLKFDGQPAAFNWFDSEALVCGPHRILMKEHEASLYDAFTDMDHRGKGLAPYIRYQSYKEMAAKGKTRIYSVSTFFNTSSIKFKQKLGARLIESHLLIVFLKKWKFRFLMGKKVHHDERP
jgi:hypothetical protein